LRVDQGLKNNSGGLPRNRIGGIIPGLTKGSLLALFNPVITWKGYTNYQGLDIGGAREILGPGDPKGEFQ